MYVLMTIQQTYFVEYLIGWLVMSDSISEAMIFDDEDTASKFSQMIEINCNIRTSIYTFIK